MRMRWGMPGGRALGMTLLGALLWSPSAAGDDGPPDVPAGYISEEAPEPGSRLDEKLLEAVFSVEIGAARGLGFLVDPSGLILTSGRLVGSSRHVTVEIAAGNLHSARVLKVSGLTGLAVLQVNQQIVAGVRPLVLARKDDDAPSPELGDPLTLVAIQEDGRREAVVVKKERGIFDSICYDRLISPREVGGPVLEHDGRVIAINVTDWPHGRKKRKGCALNASWAVNATEEARAMAAEAGPPSAAPLNVASLETYPATMARDLGSLIADPDAYRLRAGKVNVEFLTPPLIAALPRTRDDAYTPQKGFYRWQRYQETYEPAVIVQALPGLRWTGGSGFRVAGFTIFSPILFLAALHEDDLDFLSAPTASYRFKRHLDGMALLRDGVEVPPLRGGLECEPIRMKVGLEPESRMKERKVRGCHGVYRYPPDAFAPGAQLAVRIFKAGKPAEGGDVPLSDDLVRRIWVDFEPWRVAVQKARGADTSATTAEGEGALSASREP